MKKKLVAMLLCLAMVCSVSACGNKGVENTEGTEVESTEEIVITKKDLPKVKKVADYKDINAILTEENKPSADEIEQEVSAIITNAGIGFTKVTDRDVIQEGDIVKVDYTGYQNGEAFSGGSATDQWLNVSENCAMDLSTGESTGGFIDGFTTGLLGKKAGETVRYEVTFPEDYGSEELAGQTVEFEFVIHSIHTDKLISVDNITDELINEFFGKTDGISTIKELKQYAEEQLNYTAIMQYLIDNSNIEISDKYLEYRAKLCLEYELMSYYGIGLDTYLSMVEYSLEEILSSTKESLKERIKYEVICEQIAKKEKLDLDEDNFKEYIVTIFDETKTEEGLQSYYEYRGLGSVEVGKTFAISDKAVTDYFLKAYRKNAK